MYTMYSIQFTVIFVHPTCWKVKSEMCTMCTDYSYFCVPPYWGVKSEMCTMCTDYSYFRDPLLEAESERKNYYV